MEKEKKNKPLVWQTVQVKINDMLPLEINPRKITEEKKSKLAQLIEKFNIVEIPVINFDGTLITWNQRLKVMQMLGRGNEMIDARKPNRALTEQELKEYNIAGNTHAGEFDFELLQEEFSEIDLDFFDIKASEEKQPGKIKTEILKPFLRTHVLISFPPERLIEIQDLLNLIKEKDFVEYETGSN